MRKCKKPTSDHTIIEYNEWLYVHTDTAEQARKFFGVPPETEVQKVGTASLGKLSSWAIRAPNDD